MITALTAPAIDLHRPHRRHAPWWWLPAGTLAGLSLGVIARGWMRLLTDRPEFTWSGTLIIVGAFGSAGLGCAIAALARTATAQRWVTTVARIVAAVLVQPLFGGAGVVMLPTVALGAVAAWRPFRKWVRLLIALVAAVPVGFVVAGAVVEVGLTVRSLLGLALFVATYAVVVLALRFVAAPIPTHHQPPPEGATP